MQTIAYKLSEYKIIEHLDGDLWWESHFGLGTLKTGKCFINKDILFIKPSDNTGPGFLKGEFLDHLKKLPRWKKLNSIAQASRFMNVNPARPSHFLKERTAGCKMKRYSKIMSQI